jgi:excisionase family DNA binding protein
MGRLLSPRQAAETLGTSVDSLRRWEKEGILNSERTPGGQRRFREEDISALLDNPPRRGALPHPRPPLPQHEDEDDDEQMPEQMPRPEMATPPWERRVREEQANLDVTKIRREREAIVRADSEEREARQREASERQRESARRQAIAEKKAEADAAEAKRLETLRQTGRILAAIAPLDYQARVSRDLVKSVNGDAYPPTMPYYVAYSQVDARVKELLKPWRDAQERERTKIEKQNQLDQLIRSGKSYAWSETRSWDPKPAERANREVERALREEIEAEWTSDDVIDLVDDVLSEWSD